MIIFSPHRIYLHHVQYLLHEVKSIFSSKSFDQNGGGELRHRERSNCGKGAKEQSCYYRKARTDVLPISMRPTPRSFETTLSRDY